MIHRLSGIPIQPAAFTSRAVAENHHDGTTPAGLLVSGKGGGSDAALPLLAGDSVRAAAEIALPRRRMTHLAQRSQPSISHSPRPPTKASSGARSGFCCGLPLVRGCFAPADGRFYAQVPVGERQEIYGLKSAGFRDWLTDCYVIDHPEPPTDAAVRRAAGVLEARARFNTRIPEIFVRIGQEADGQGDESLFPRPGRSQRAEPSS